MKNKPVSSGLLSKVSIVLNALAGNLLKLRALYDIYIRRNITLSPQQDDTVVVSLTSYGIRVRNSLPYTVYSLLKQDLRPKSIVVWLDEQEFDDSKLPNSIQFLRRFGLEVRYCRNLRSYKKIIFSLSAFTDKHIITVDDDIYYSKTLVAELMRAHRQHPLSILAGTGRTPIANGDCQLLPYTRWPEYINVFKDFSYDNKTFFPIGWGGVLYPAHIFDEEALNENVFMKLCSKADDVWLYVMGLRCKAPKHLLAETSVKYYHIDIFRQYLQKDRLTETNRFEGENDNQLEALLNYYRIDYHIFHPGK